MAQVRLVSNFSAGVLVVRRTFSSRKSLVTNAVSAGVHDVSRSFSGNRQLCSEISAGKVAPNELKDMSIRVISEI